jgi:hypothetical protein
MVSFWLLDQEKIVKFDFIREIRAYMLKMKKCQVASENIEIFSGRLLNFDKKI